MPRIPEHPLHPTLCAWADWMRAGAHDNQGWPGMSNTAPDLMRAMTETDGIAKNRRRYREPEDAEDRLKIPRPRQATPTQPRSGQSRMPCMNPAPAVSWIRITRALIRLQRSPQTKDQASAVILYYVLREGPYTEQTRRGCDLLHGALIVENRDFLD